MASKSLCIRVVGEWANANMSTEDVLIDDYIHSNTCSNHDRFIRRMYEMQMPSNIAIPKLFRSFIDDNITPILNQIRNWIVYHHSKRFFHDEPASSMNEYLIKLAWKADYLIDYGATARNILTNDRLNIMEKFRFACTYCLVDEIRKLQEMSDVTIYLNFEIEPFLVYWSKYLKNNLHTIRLPKDVSMDTVMFQKSFQLYNLWSPAAYFFAKLDTTAKLSEFPNFMKHCGQKYRRELLEKLNDEGWTVACRNSIVIVMENYAKCGDFEDTRYVWRQFADQVDSKNLCRVIVKLVPLSMRNCRNFNELTPLLIDIWISVRNEVQNPATIARFLRHIGAACSKIFDDDEKFDFNSRRELREPMKFWRVLLSSVEREHRENFMRVNFLWLTLWQPFAAVNELLEEFVVDYECVEKLKVEMKYSAKLHQICSKLLQFGEFDEFNDIVRFFWFDERYSFSQADVDYVKRSLVMSPPGVKALSGYLFLHGWNRLFEFVRGIFWPEISISPTRYMMQLIDVGFSNTAFDQVFQETRFLAMKICRGELSDVVDLVNTFGRSAVVNFNALTFLSAHALLQCLFNEPEGMVFKASEIDDFLKWSSGNEKAPEDFRKTTAPHFPKAFLGQLKNCVDDFTFRASDSMEAFLQWCFANETKIRSFKRDMIYRHRDYKLIGDLLAQRKYRRCMLQWFFHNDDDSIEEFKNNELRMSPNRFENC
ncbi:hypothetical protein U1Q18_047115 [Sarracenia purpurea var. burkii]